MELWNIKVTVIPIIIGTLGTVTKKIGTETGGLGNGRTSEDYSNYSIVKNTEKSCGNLNRLAVTKTNG